MFDPTSRYANLPTLVYRTPDGGAIPYKARRFCPPASSLRQLTEVTVRDGDRLDLITARTLGVPQQYWRVCDANDAMEPAELVAVPGRRLRIPVPQD